jgi:hypothetical protein
MSKSTCLSRSFFCIAIIAALAACNDDSREAADFSPGTQETPAPPAEPAGTAPAELSQEERSLPLVAGGECNLERLDGERFAGEPMKAPAATVNLSGWLADTRSRQIPQSFELRMVEAQSNRAWKVQGQTGTEREDVQALLGGEPGFAHAGYSVAVDTSALPQGTYRMYVVFDGGSGLVSCDNGRSLVVGP